MACKTILHPQPGVSSVPVFLKHLDQPDQVSVGVLDHELRLAFEFGTTGACFIPNLPQVPKRPDAQRRQPRARGADVGNFDLKAHPPAPRRTDAAGELWAVFFEHELGAVESEAREQGILPGEEDPKTDSFDVEVEAREDVADGQLGNERIPTHSPIMAYVPLTGPSDSVYSSVEPRTFCGKLSLNRSQSHRLRVK